MPKEKRSQIQSTGWTFTNFDMDFDYSKFKEDPELFLIYGLEQCPDTGRMHHQGYIRLKKKCGFGKIKEALPGMHIEQAKGSPKQNIDYCSKDGKITVIGELKKQGERTDLSAFMKAVYENPSMGKKEMIELSPETWARNYRALEVYRSVYEEKRNWVPEVYYIWGPTNTGKTRHAVEAGATKVWFKNNFFSGYDGEDIVLFDDIDKWTFLHNRNVLLEILDRYAYSINIKGGERNWKPKIIYITSNFSPEMTFDNDAAVMRRLTQITHLTLTEVKQEVMKQEVGEGNTTPPLTSNADAGLGDQSSIHPFGELGPLQGQDRGTLSLIEAIGDAEF